MSYRLIISLSVVGLTCEQLGRVLLHAAGGLEGGLDELLLEVAGDLLERRCPRAAARSSEAGNAGCRTVSGISSGPMRVPGHSTTARSMTFSSSRTLPGQSYSRSRSSASGVEFEIAAAVLLPVLLEEVLHQQRDVVLALAQRRQVHGDDVQPVVEVLAEAALVDHRAQVDVGRRDDAHVDLDRLDAAEAHELALLDHAQQLGLRLERHVADLVEEDAALVGDLEQALLGRDGAGEGALHVAEQVALEQVRGQVAGVDGDERLLGAGELVWIARATSSLPVPLSP